MTKDEAAEIIDQCGPLLESIQRLIERCEDTIRKPDLYLVEEHPETEITVEFEPDWD